MPKSALTFIRRIRRAPDTTSYNNAAFNNTSNIEKMLDVESDDFKCLRPVSTPSATVVTGDEVLREGENDSETYRPCPRVQTLLKVIMIYLILFTTPVFDGFTKHVFQYLARKKRELKQKKRDFDRQLDLKIKYRYSPQILVDRGRYHKQSSSPFLSSDIWMEVADYETNFFVRPYDANYPQSERQWIRWLNKKNKRNPIILIMNNQQDKPWPCRDNTFTTKMLSHPNVKYLYVSNPKILHDKVRPLPVGLKYQYYSMSLYGEPKSEKNTLYQSISNLPLETKELFSSIHKPNRTLTVWVRPMRRSDRYGMYDKTNEALNTSRGDICNILKKNAPFTAICSTHSSTNESNVYFDELKKHTFVASPPGRGLDSHATWEALLAGCIPIVPHSTLDPMFQYLPVWLIDSWEEVTDIEVQRKQKYFHQNLWNWDKIFIDGWINEIRNISNQDEVWQNLV